MRPNLTSRWPSVALGTGAYLACLLFALAMSVLAQGWRLAVVCAFVLLLASVCFPAGLGVLRDRRLLLFLVFLMAPLALLAEPKSLNLAGVALSQQGIADGARMALRAVTIAVAVAGFAASVSVGELSRLLERSGVYGPYLELAEACEDPDMMEVPRLCDNLLISPEILNRAHVQALAWVEELGV